MNSSVDYAKINNVEREMGLGEGCEKERDEGVEKRKRRLRYGERETERERQL